MSFAPPKSIPQPPLPELMRPDDLDLVVGQEHLTGPGAPLRTAVENGFSGAMIFWGPPGTGKTTIAKILAASSGMDFIPLSAVLSGVADIREAVKRATENKERGTGTVVFVDEVTAGTTSGWRHFGQRDAVPALLSATLSRWPQWRQEKRMGMIRSRF